MLGRIQKGNDICGVSLPKGLKESERLKEPILHQQQRQQMVKILTLIMMTFRIQLAKIWLKKLKNSNKDI